MGQFLEAAIRSVIQQDYPRVEYLVMDGGSTDGTLEILRRYEGRLRYISAPDRGQADAVNRGFQLTQGSIFAFLNADDAYLPGAISAVVQAFAQNPEAGVIYGEAWHVGEDGSRISPYPVEQFQAGRLARRCFICQPAAFIRREVFEASGMLNPDLHFALDYDLWIRIARRYPMLKIDTPLAVSRVHGENKTIRQMAVALRETLIMLKRNYGYVPFNWLYGYGHHYLTGQRLVFEAPRPAIASACLSLALGMRYNWRHPLRFCRDIFDTSREGLAWIGRS